MGCCDPANNPANFRHLITIETVSLVANDSGGQTESWATFATVWASIKPRLGDEKLFAQKIEQEKMSVWRIKYLAGLDSKMRISFDSRIFQIKSFIIEDEIKEYMVILAAESPGT